MHTRTHTHARTHTVPTHTHTRCAALRIGTAEVESALAAHPSVAEAAVVGYPHSAKGQGLCCYVTLAHGAAASPNLLKELKMQVRAAKTITAGGSAG
jgi:acyl-coenzyme A synthetase/AMP-(fatty) acid ligase